MMLKTLLWHYRLSVLPSSAGYMTRAPTQLLNCNDPAGIMLTPSPCNRLSALVQCKIHDTLTQLLNCNDPAVLPLVLVAQIGFAVHREHFKLVSSSNCLDVLLRIVQHYDLPFKRLAADLLALLSRREVVVSGGPV